MKKWCRKRNSKTTKCQKVTLFIACIHLCQCQSKRKSSNQPQVDAESSLFRPISLKLPSLFPISVMLWILVRRSTDTMRECGNREKGGEAELWPNKERVELAEPLMDTAIGCILLLFMPILWTSILFPRSANCP